MKQALLDVILTLFTLYVIKYSLLQIPMMWTFAGPISLLAALGVASWRLKRSQQTWLNLGLFKVGRISTLAMWTIIATLVAIFGGALISSAVTSLLADSTSMIDPEAVDFMQNRFSNVPGNVPVYLYWLLISWVIGGLTEELLFRGFLIIKLEQLFSKIPFGLFLAIFVQALIFGQLHMYYQGLEGFIVTGLLAIFSGLIFIFSGRRLWALIVSHGLTNSFGMTMIFLSGT